MKLHMGRELPGALQLWADYGNESGDFLFPASMQLLMISNGFLRVN